MYNSPYAFSENKVTAHVEIEGLESRGFNDARKYDTRGNFAGSAMRKNVTSNLQSASENSTKVLSVTGGVQAAGIGAEVKLG